MPLTHNQIDALAAAIAEAKPAARPADMVLHRFFREHPQLGARDPAPAVAHGVPDWLWDRLGNAVGDDEREAMTRAWLQPAPLDIRINPLTTEREAVRAQLEAAGIAAMPTPHSPLGLRIAGRP